MTEEDKKMNDNQSSQELKEEKEKSVEDEVIESSEEKNQDSMSNDVNEETEEKPVEEEFSVEDELRETIQNLEDRNLRLQAEIANMQRSNSRERQEAAKYRSQSLANKLIDAIDNLERALQIEASTEESQAIHKGIQMVYEQILNAFKEEKIEVINPLNETFDPNYHQAVTTQPAEEGQETDIVVNVLQKGYILNDRIIRPAMVIVSA
ncbi:nucleotide exchange factor GrpE [Facklamia sp. 7083-14-GEN3]|uniref:nucleotide exchange factor GrpE n=1 Tax=Facklamia sp. 7083-14-GEN3 TaxID=2973478 RepID=UPI00215C9BD6|nr:nucleotide exchange factor GrpE [Facklamia sp. 7083-14-GEN3]MCR8968800.1 nucleotide exchange factor GrpE [Facklamia sp. 7083-14-GEN3]